MDKFHDVRNLKFLDDRLLIEIDGEERMFSLNDISKKLAKASPLERTTYEVSPSGYGIHWPLLDEDLSINGLLGIIQYPGVEKLSA